MNLRVLRYLAEIIDSGSMNKAAVRLHVSQPSLTRQIRNLEHGLGFSIFRRDGSRLQLTESGALFLPVARDLLSRAEAAETLAMGLATGQARHLTVAAPMSTITELLAPFIAAAGRNGSVLSLHKIDPSEAQDELLRGADIVFTTAPLAVKQSFEWCQLGRTPLWVYPPAEHRWSASTQLSVSELVSEKLVLLTVESEVRRQLDREVLKAGAMYSSYIECGLGIVAQAQAAAGQGVAVVSDFPRFGLRGIPLVSAEGLAELGVCAVWRSDHYAADDICQLVGRIRKFMIEVRRLNTRVCCTDR